MGAVQCVVSAGGSLWVSATTRSATSAPKGATREGRVLSCNRPFKPSAMKRSCQRQTQVFDLPVCRMISLVADPRSRQKDDLGSPHMLLGTVAICGHSLQMATD